MVQLKVILITLVGLYVFATIIIAFASVNINNNKIKLRHLSQSNEPELIDDDTLQKSLQFTNTLIAYQLLTQLDVFEGSGSDDYAQWHPSGGLLWGLTRNDRYCHGHRTYFVNNPQFIFEEMNFLADEPMTHLLRARTIPAIGKDMHLEIGYGMNETIQDSFTINQKPNINIFYTNPFMHERRVVGKEYSCLTQISNHIPGNDKLGRKDLTGGALVEYTRQYDTRPTCFNNDKFFPKTWVLSNYEQCRDFFFIFNSEDYKVVKEQREIVYIRKIGVGVHKGEGVFPVDDEDENYIRALYDNGNYCGEVWENNVIQYFIHNPLLLEGRKFDFRIYMLIASTNPLVVYYHDGFLRMSLQKYDIKTHEKGSLLTNIAVSAPIFEEAAKNGTYNGLTEDEIKEEAYWQYSDLFNYLREQGKVTDPNWIENFLRTEVKKAMIHLTRMSQDIFHRKSSLHELYGVDFMMDDNLNLWYIEANARPGIDGWNEDTRRYKHKLLTDSFEIVFGFLRSRTKRIINYINYLTELKEGAYYFIDDTIEILNLEERREEFRLLTMNQFEPEFEPSPQNEFQKIIDEHFDGVDRYMGLIDEYCL